MSICAGLRETSNLEATGSTPVGRANSPYISTSYADSALCSKPEQCGNKQQFLHNFCTKSAHSVLALFSRITAAFQCADTCQKPRFPACFTHKKLEQCGNIGYQFARRSTLYLKEVNMSNQAQKRRSRDDVWPLLNAEGLTFAEAKRRKDAENARSIYTKA